METVLKFATYLAWVAGVLSTVVLLARIVSGVMYERSVQQLADRVKGVQRTFPIAVPGSIAIVAWCFILAL